MRGSVLTSVCVHTVHTGGGVGKRKEACCIEGFELYPVNDGDTRN